MDPITLVYLLLRFYYWLIIGYVILSWVPADGIVGDIRRALETVCEPYLGIFRRFIPPIGMIDISPIVAILVLSVFMRLLVGLR